MLTDEKRKWTLRDTYEPFVSGSQTQAGESWWGLVHELTARRWVTAGGHFHRNQVASCNIPCSQCDTKNTSFWLGGWGWGERGGVTSVGATQTWRLREGHHMALLPIMTCPERGLELILLLISWCWETMSTGSNLTSRNPLKTTSQGIRGFVFKPRRVIVSLLKANLERRLKDFHLKMFFCFCFFFLREKKFFFLT